MMKGKKKTRYLDSMIKCDRLKTDLVKNGNREMEMRILQDCNRRRKIPTKRRVSRMRMKTMMTILDRMTMMRKVIIIFE